ncbi:two component transcriptional regulator, LytTR family [Flavisolibacter ginsengisoli DSM 18119]|jgi:DNA-binding LytR/AlgR family response regulator|uniref:Two component transcriptional regulator, LytTR family n=2 Tax=Flavisolibacter TaxID=398041 RepID=A0A1M4UBZ0_9BACT|nr:two component transcriptional regulator, LytTR family [Flavisolibacter ginsengisoli DSM 18119]
MPDKTMAIKCLIIDDEPPAREVLKRYVEQLPMLQLTGECSNAIQAIGMLQQQDIDLLFLDIRMPQLNGIDFLRTLNTPPKIIFTTAFAEYAVEGYELDIADYLMKPIRFDRFIKAVNKAFPKQPTIDTEEKFQPLEEKRTESFVYFRADRKMVKVLLNDILYIESMKDYVKVYTTNTTIITKQSLSSVETMLPEKRFIRTHRSFIVAIHHISTFTNEIIEINKTEIPIGKLYRNTVLKLL